MPDLNDPIWDRRRRVRRIHLVGIGGVGMAGIAEVLVNLGYRVSGSDLKMSASCERLKKLGAEVHIGHDARLIEGADVVVVSSAIPQDNPEVLAARKKRLPVLARAEMLAELMRFKFGIAVAGTHGKTTTTSLIASILTEADLDPTFVVGGKLNRYGCHATLGKGPYFVVEADESDASLLHLQPMISVVTNIDRDHMETYTGCCRALQETFLQFLHQLPFYGLAVLCLDDLGVRSILPHISRPLKTYGLTPEADLHPIHVRHLGRKTRFEVAGAGSPFPVELNLPGRHNLQNALAAIAVAHELEVPTEAIQRALASFSGVARRFQIREIPFEEGAVILVDDYAHHPREIEATLEAARQVWPYRCFWVVFQPHRYTRTRDLLEEFAAVLAPLEHLVLLPVYAAGEEPQEGGTTDDLLKALRQKGAFPAQLETLSEVAPFLKPRLSAGDVVLLLGAGSIGQLAQILLQTLRSPNVPDPSCETTR